MDRFRHFVAELKRRRVFRTAVAYLVGAWLLVQVAATTFPLLGLADWMARAVLVVLLLGFPVAMVLAWAFDLGAAGLQLTPDSATPAEGDTPHYGSLPLIAVIALMVGAGIGAFFALGGLHAPRASGKSIAVLPFENIGGRAEDAYLADGLQEEILNALARLRDLKVISRSSVMEFRDKAHNVREIGKRLDVATVLEGSVRREGDKLRLTVQLIDARSDDHLLAVNYDRDLAHVLELQSAVAKVVANTLTATLSKRERGELERVATNSGDAYDRYLRAVAVFHGPMPDDPQGLVVPRRMLEEALSFDADYADAQALLARVETWNWFVHGNHAEDADAARRAWERALAIDPALPEAVMARGLYTMYIERDLDRAIADFTSVLSQRPNNVEARSLLSFALRRKARFDEALEHQVKAWELDPLNETYATAPLTTLIGLRRYPEAIAQAALLAQRFPSKPDGYFFKAGLESYMQHSSEPLREALQQHGALLKQDERDTLVADIAQNEGRYRDALAVLAKLPVDDRVARNLRLGALSDAAGDSEKAQQHYREALSGVDVSLPNSGQIDPMVALAQSLLGEHAAALATIDQARSDMPESMDAINAPFLSFVRSVILVRAGRVDEGHAEVARLLRVPFGGGVSLELMAGLSGLFPLRWAVHEDHAFDEIFDNAPRL